MNPRRRLRLVLEVLLTALGLFAARPAQAIGVWYPAASMNEGRTHHHAILLSDGRVLVVGEADPEVYDPASDSWSATGPMAHGTLSPSAAALLGDGRVLVVGDPYSVRCHDAEVYSPITNSWSSLPDSLVCRDYRGTATRLMNGRVLVAGGNSPSDPPGTSEIFDPISGTWTLTAEMLDPNRWDGDPTATLLKDGRVLVVGGNDFSLAPVDEVYDPTTDAWNPTGPMVTASLHRQTATRLESGKVLVAGGYLWAGSGGATAITQVYDPVTNSWSQAGDLNVMRSGHTATLLDDGRVLVVGGTNQDSYLQSSEIYDPATNLWTLDAPMNGARASAAAVALKECAVQVTGGFPGPTASAEIYSSPDPDGDLFSGTCDNCPIVYNPDQADKEHDGKGDVCDTDDDNDGCKDTVDEDPFSSVHKTGYYTRPPCIPSSGILLDFAGGDTDGDGLLDCEDPDNENDGIPDVSDACPTTPGSDPASCTFPAPCVEQSLFDLCNGADCEQFFLKLVGLVDPDPLIIEVIFEHIQVVNDVLYVYPIQGTTLGQSAIKFAPAQGGGPAGTPQTCELVRLEAWAKEQPGSPEHLVMLIAEYNPCDVVIGSMDRGAVLLVFPPSPIQPSLTVDAVWVAGMFPRSVIYDDADGDEFPDPFDNCEQAENTDQTDTDSDRAGDVCDCAAADDSAFAIPAEVIGVTFFADHASLTWDSGVPNAGYGTVHDVLRGYLDELPVGSGSSEWCLASDIGTSAADYTVPAAGQGYWYDVRGANVCGNGTYGFASDGTPRESGACP